MTFEANESYMQPSFQFAISAQLDEDDFSERQLHEVQGLRDRVCAGVFDVSHSIELLRWYVLVLRKLSEVRG